MSKELEAKRNEVIKQASAALREGAQALQEVLGAIKQGGLAPQPAIEPAHQPAGALGGSDLETLKQALLARLEENQQVISEMDEALGS